MKFGIDTLKIIFLLFLVVSGNFIGELLSVKQDKFLQIIYMLKHIILNFYYILTIDFNWKRAILLN